MLTAKRDALNETQKNGAYADGVLVMTEREII